MLQYKFSISDCIANYCVFMYYVVFVVDKRACDCLFYQSALITLDLWVVRVILCSDCDVVVNRLKLL